MHPKLPSACICALNWKLSKSGCRSLRQLKKLSWRRVLLINGKCYRRGTSQHHSLHRLTSRLHCYYLPNNIYQTTYLVTIGPFVLTLHLQMPCGTGIYWFWWDVLNVYFDQKYTLTNMIHSVIWVTIAFNYLLVEFLQKMHIVWHCLPAVSYTHLTLPTILRV